MLRYSEEKLEQEDSITAIFFKAQKELDARRKLYEQFRRKITDEELASLTDEDIKIPLERYLSVMAIGFFSGIPPIYKVHAYDEERNKLNKELFGGNINDEQAVKEIENIIKHITDYNDDGAEHQNLSFDYFVKRACYELIYKNEEGEIVYSNSDALETVAIWDYSIPKNIIGLYRIIQTTMANGEYQIMVELTTKNGKRYYMDTPEKRKLFGTTEYEMKYKEQSLFKEDKKLYQKPKWKGDLPVIAIENEHGLNIFECVSSLIRAYERVIQNSRNTFQYNDEAILKVIGYEPENEMIIQDENGNDIINPARVLEDKYVLESKVRYLQENGDLDWVIKAVNDSALQNHKKTLMDLICLCSFVPNMTDLGFTQADNNSALEKKFFSLQQLISTADNEFKKGYLRRWELILNKFNNEKGKKYDFRDIEVTLLRNMPSDKESDTSRALSLLSVLPTETVIGMLPDNLDPKAEMFKKREESETNLEDNIKKISSFSKENSNNNDGVDNNEQSRNIDKKMEEDKTEVGGISQKVSEIKRENSR